MAKQTWPPKKLGETNLAKQTWPSKKGKQLTENRLEIHQISSIISSQKNHNGLVLQERGKVFLTKQTWPKKLGKKLGQTNLAKQTWTNNTWPNKLGCQKNLAKQTWPNKLGFLTKRQTIDQE